MKKITLSAVLIALAIALSIFEKFIPINAIIPIPGIKLGLANIVTMFALIKLSKKDAFLILIARITLVSLLVGTISSFLFSFLGGILSLWIMSILIKYKDKYFSIIGISIAGAAMHNVGQILAAIIVLKTTNVILYLQMLLVISIIVGIINGLILKNLIEKLDKLK